MQHHRGDFTANRRLLLLSALALVIGMVSAFVAKALLLLIAFFTQLFFGAPSASASHLGIFLILIPAIGGLIIGLMARFGSERIRGHGIPEALEAILFGKSVMQPKVAVLKPISAAISIGSGGPFGAEGPIIMTGGAVGSLIAQKLHLTSAERKTLLVAGAAAGMSAIFATPIAAALLAVELLLFELKPRSFVPVAIATATAALIRPHLLGVGPLFPVEAHAPFGETALLQSVLVGIVAGGVSALLSKTLYRLEDFFQALPVHWMWWPAAAGILVGIGGYLEPRALGVGYDVIGDFLSGHSTLASVPYFVLIKASIWLIALASGTSGGVLAPLLIFGAGLGAIESYVLSSSVSPATWSLISMGAILGGMMRAPLTAILFSFELTRDANSLLPLMIASVCAHAFTVLVMKRSILTEKIARRGFDVFREYAVDPLERMTVKEVMQEGEYALLFDEGNTISSKETCRVAAEKMALGELGLLGVRDENGAMVGTVSWSDLLKARKAHHHEESHHEYISW